MNAPQDGLKQAAARPVSFLQTMQAVAWSFLGIRKRAGFEQDVQKLNPVHVVMGGILGAVIFVAVLVMLVRWVVGSGVAVG
jgi:Protein of unknown function (DUF2970)